MEEMENGNYKHEELLREEAIKWARKESAMMISVNKNKLMGHIGRFQVLCEFFNITEEDLK